MSELLEHLINRTSTPADALGEPAPDEAELDRILAAAVAVPDHGALRPWRFLLIRGEARARLGEVFAETTRANLPDTPEDKLAKIRAKPLRAPLIIAVVAAIQADSKIPEHEQFLSAGAAAQNILLAARSLGYGAIWLTGPFATEARVMNALGVEPPERIVSFIYVGTPAADKDRTEEKLGRRPDPRNHVREWTGPGETN